MVSRSATWFSKTGGDVRAACQEQHLCVARAFTAAATTTAAAIAARADAIEHHQGQLGQITKAYSDTIRCAALTGNRL
jgi:hypothetical protein